MDGLFGPGQYRLLPGTIALSSDKAMPLERTKWRILRLLLSRFHLFDVTGAKTLVAPISRFGARDATSPLCLERIPFSGIGFRGFGDASP